VILELDLSDISPKRRCTVALAAFALGHLPVSKRKKKKQADLNLAIALFLLHQLIPVMDSTASSGTEFHKQRNGDMDGSLGNRRLEFNKSASVGLQRTSKGWFDRS